MDPDAIISDPEDYNTLDHIYTSNQPETFQIIGQWQQHIDQYQDK